MSNALGERGSPAIGVAGRPKCPRKVQLLELQDDGNGCFAGRLYAYRCAAKCCGGDVRTFDINGNCCSVMNGFSRNDLSVNEGIISQNVLLALS